MGVINGKAGRVIYVKATYPQIPFYRIEEQLILPGKFLKYYGQEPEIVEIPDDPIIIELSEPNFETADKAKLPSITIEITVTPNLDEKMTLEDIRKCVSAFEEGATTGEEWLKNRLRKLLTTLREYPLSSILDNTDIKFKKDNSGIKPGDSFENKVKKLSKVLENNAETILMEHNFVVSENSCIIKYELPEIENLKDENPNHHPIIFYLSKYHSQEEKLKEEKHAHQKSLDELRQVYEHDRQTMKEKAEADILDIKKEFLGRKHEAEKMLQEAEANFKQEMDLLKEQLEKTKLEILADVEAEKTKIEMTKEKKVSEIKEQIKTEMEIIKINEQLKLDKEKARLAQESAKHEIEKKQAEFSIEEEEREYQKKTQMEKIKTEEEIESEKHKFESKRIEQQKNLAEVEKDLIDYRENNPISLNYLLEQEQLKQQLEIATTQDQIDEIQMKKVIEKEDRDREIEQEQENREYAVEKDRENRERDYEAGLIKSKNQFETEVKKFEKEAVMELFRFLLSDRDKHFTNSQKFITQLGEQFTKATQAHASSIKDYKVVNFSGIDSESPISNYASQIFQVLMQLGTLAPHFRDILGQFGVDMSGTGSDTESDTESSSGPIKEGKKKKTKSKSAPPDSSEEADVEDIKGSQRSQKTKLDDDQNF